MQVFVHSAIYEFTSNGLKDCFLQKTFTFIAADVKCHLAAVKHLPILHNNIDIFWSFETIVPIPDFENLFEGIAPDKRGYQVSILFLFLNENIL